MEKLISLSKRNSKYIFLEFLGNFTQYGSADCTVLDTCLTYSVLEKIDNK